jgi:hypothetical protein
MLHCCSMWPVPQQICNKFSNGSRASFIILILIPSEARAFSFPNCFWLSVASNSYDVTQKIGAAVAQAV